MTVDLRKPFVPNFEPFQLDPFSLTEVKPTSDFEANRPPPPPPAVNTNFVEAELNPEMNAAPTEYIYNDAGGNTEESNGRPTEYVYGENEGEYYYYEDSERKFSCFVHLKA